MTLLVHETMQIGQSLSDNPVGLTTAGWIFIAIAWTTIITVKVKKYFRRGVSGNTSHLQNHARSDANSRNYGDKTRAVDSAKAMRVMGTAVLIFVLMLLLLLVAWLER